MTSTKVAECPACGGSDLDLYRKSAPWVLTQCRNCSLVASDPRPDDSSLRKLYEKRQYFSERIAKVSTIEADRARAAGLVPAFDDLTRVLGRKGRLLEIGSAYGYLLAAAKMAGWETVGLELSPHAASSARETFGLEIHEAPASELQNLNLGGFDAVLMFSVIEHLPDPLAVVREVRASLKPGGCLWAVVPNVASLDRYWHGEDWTGWDLPYHLWHFSPSTMNRLCRNAGFGEVRIEKTFFNPVRHVRLGLKSGNLRADIRGAGPQAEPAVERPAPVQQGPRRSMVPQVLRCLVKNVFSERDMHVWALK